MISAHYNEDEFNRLVNALNIPGIEGVVDFVLEVAAEEIKTRLEANSPVYSPQKPDVRPKDQRHPPGLFKLSWRGPFKEGPGLFSFTNTQPYGDTLEEGLFSLKQLVAVRADGTPGRLTEIDGKIYSRMTNNMRGGPVASPVINDPVLRDRVLELLSRQISEYFRKSSL